ncbi:MAG: hypothetical protein AB9869_12130 [Verrucomicrobiia bacterium]
MRVLVDTCVWTHFLRRNRTETDRVAAELERLIRADLVDMLGPIRQELLSGAQPQERFAQLKAYLRFYPNLPLDEEDDESAAQYLQPVPSPRSAGNVHGPPHLCRRSPAQPADFYDGH